MKKIMALMIGISVMATLVGCGNGKISNDKITIEQYKGIEVEKVETPKVTDEDVEKGIQAALKATAKEVTDRAVKDGDIATIDFVGKRDGVEFDGGAAEDVPLEIGSGTFIPGFEEGVIGHKIGETFDLNLTFPEPYPNNPDLAGKDVVFTVTVKGIKGIPELTDDLVKEISKKSKTVDEYKKEVKASLEKSNKETAESAMKQKIWDALMNKTTVSKYPEDKKKELTDNITQQYDKMAEMYNMEDGEKLAETMYGMTIEEMVENTLKQEMAVELIAKEEKIEVTEKEYKSGLKKFAKQYGYDEEADFEKEVGKDNIKRALLQDEVTDWLVAHCKQVDKKEESK